MQAYKLAHRDRRYRQTYPHLTGEDSLFDLIL